MFGVLVVRAPDGRVGVLRAFSGMLEGSWFVPGFVPPAYDVAAKAHVWTAGEAELATIDARIAQLTAGAEAEPPRRELAALDARQATELAALTTRHRAAKAERARRRTETETEATAAPSPRAAALHELAQQSRGDTAEHRRLVASHAASRAALAAGVAALDAERDQLVAHRAARSRVLLHGIHDAYVLASARGALVSVRAIFAPAEPPGGAGDCAAPKLLAHAYRLGAVPLALAEFWSGPPPATGGRADGVYYPACRGKCGPILAHMLDGLAVDAAPEYGAAPIAADEPRVVYADDQVIVVDKPAGLLSVPGRSGRLRDSVQTRMRARYPHATGPLVVHRLDLDTSGLLLVALDSATHAALQADFARRAITKRYIAVLDGALASPAGTIELPLRVDLDDRPRQLVDPVHGKSAHTDYETVAVAGGRTRVALYPRTGRTHQLRVHCAHPLGLGAPIAGDRLYGGPTAPRLLLHAESLAFTHPKTGLRIELTSEVPF